jgi:hypothetical protein
MRGASSRETLVRFSVSAGIPIQVPGCVPCFWLLVSAKESLVGFIPGGDVNHEHVSVPGVQALSKQHLTSFTHYESAWRTENTGSNPVGARSESGRSKASEDTGRTRTRLVPKIGLLGFRAPSKAVEGRG